MAKANNKFIVLVGFMGVGKSTVARHLSYLLRRRRIDLDARIEAMENRTIAEIIKADGEARFRQIETECLRAVFTAAAENTIVALGGGAWTITQNRAIIKKHDCQTVWLESRFEHCWGNIRASKRERPLAADKRQARRLFEERQKHYCLADWHFVVKPGFDSREIAGQIAEQIFLLKN